MTNYNEKIQVGEFHKLNKGNQDKVMNLGKWITDLDFKIINVEKSTTDFGEYAYIKATYKHATLVLRVNRSNDFWINAYDTETSHKFMDTDSITKLVALKEELCVLTIIIDQSITLQDDQEDEPTIDYSEQVLALKAEKKAIRNFNFEGLNEEQNRQVTVKVYALDRILSNNLMTLSEVQFIFMQWLRDEMFTYSQQFEVYTNMSFNTGGRK